jgi:hypothetical protein
MYNSRSCKSGAGVTYGYKVVSDLWGGLCLKKTKILFGVPGRIAMRHAICDFLSDIYFFLKIKEFFFILYLI